LSRLGDAKTLGGIGSILLLVPGASIVGYILVLIAGKYVSDELADKSIFDNMLYAVITGIVGVAAFVFVLITGLVAGILTFGIGAILGVITAFAVIWIFMVISSIFIKRAFNTMAARLNVNSFRTAGTLYFIGSLLTIVLVGFVILFIAYIFQIVAFFSISEAAPVGTRYCPACGTQVPQTASVCPKCGAKLQA